LAELHDLLDQHDYDSPQVGDIRQGIIVSINTQGVIVDLGLKRDGLVPISDLNKLEPDERDALKVNDEVFVYVLNTDKPDSLVVSIHLARLNQDWIRAEELLESKEIIEAEVIGYNKGGAIVPFGRLRGFVPISHLTDVNPGNAAAACHRSKSPAPASCPVATRGAEGMGFQTTSRAYRNVTGR
jgi:small subunit ribosomal protein S1